MFLNCILWASTGLIHPRTPPSRQVRKQQALSNVEFRAWAKGVEQVECAGQGGLIEPSRIPGGWSSLQGTWGGGAFRRVWGRARAGHCAGALPSKSTGGERALRGRRGLAGPWHGSPCLVGDSGGPGVEGRCFHHDASSLPRSLPHPARPRSLPSVPPSSSSLPPTQPPSRPPQPPPEGTCVALVQFPLSLGCLSAGLRWLALPTRAPSPPAWALLRPPCPPESFSQGHRGFTWNLHLTLELAIGGATCGRALRLARPDRPAPALR